MAGFGGIAEEPQTLETNRAVTKRTQDLVDNSFQLARTDVAAGLQVMAQVKAPPKEPFLVTPPALKLPPEAVSFIKSPLKRRELVGTVSRYTTVNPQGHITIDLTKIREEHLRILDKAGLKKTQAEKVSDYVIKVCRERLKRQAIDTSVLYHTGEKKAAENQAAMMVGKAVTSLAAKMGDGTLTKNQEEYLKSIEQAYHKRTGKDMTAQQREDMYRAALQAGFSSKVIFSLAKPKKESAGPKSTGTTESTVMSPTLVMMAQQVAFRLNDELRKARRAYDSNKGDPEAREQYEAAKTRLKDFLGSPGALKDLEDLGDAEKDVVLGALANHLNATMALKSGNLKQVLPKPRQRAA